MKSVEFSKEQRKFIVTLYNRLKKNINNPPKLGSKSWPEKMVDEFNIAMLTGSIGRIVDESNIEILTNSVEVRRK